MSDDIYASINADSDVSVIRKGDRWHVGVQGGTDFYAESLKSLQWLLIGIAALNHRVPAELVERVEGEIAHFAIKDAVSFGDAGLE